MASPDDQDVSAFSVPGLAGVVGPPSESDVRERAPVSSASWRYHRDQRVGDRYRLVRPLALGGMAELWIAEHTDLRTEVVVKFMMEKPRDDPDWLRQALERFRLEAQVTAQLAKLSKHIVAVHDAGSFEGTPYLVMEFVRGKTLEEVMQAEGVVDVGRFADILDQVAHALGAAHGSAIIHRDLKPSNLIVGVDPSGSLLVKVADFGVAKAKQTNLLIEKPKETSAALLVGSPAYASPEQIYGMPLDGRSDIWSLGVVAYEALTGAQPFGSTASGEIAAAELFVNIATRPFQKPSSIANLPRGLDRWFLRALAKEPEGRFADVEEMAAAFRKALETSFLRERGWILAGAAALVLAGSTAFALSGRTPASPSPAPLTSSRAAMAEPPVRAVPAASASASSTSAGPSSSASEEPAVARSARPAANAAPSAKARTWRPPPPKPRGPKKVNPDDIQ
jgi:eukaryotic-like serine/threonine-protein kinase